MGKNTHHTHHTHRTHHLHPPHRLPRGVGRWAALLPAIILLCACVSHSGQPLNVIRDTGPDKAPAAAQKKKDKKKAGKIRWVQQPIEKGSLINTLDSQGAQYLMNFEDIAIPQFIEAMMTGVFKRNYLITDSAKSISGRFTVKMTEDLDAGRAFQLFKSILSMYNVDVEKVENTYVFSKGKGASVTLRGPIIYGRRVPNGFPVGDNDEVTFLVPFHNIAPDTLKTIIQELLPARSVLFPVPQLNLLVINGNYENIKHTLTFIDLLDRAQFKDKSIVMVTPEYWDIEDFAVKVRHLLAAEGVNPEVLEKTRNLVFIPIEKLNSLIVISPVSQWVERVLYWLEKLDVPEAAGASKKVFAYKLKNVDVEGVFEILEAYRTGTVPAGLGPIGAGGRGIGRSGGSRGGSGRSGSGSRGSGTTSGRSSGRSSGGSGSATGKRGGGLAPVGTQPPPGPGQEPTADDVAIMPVYDTNTIVIIATPVDYKKYLDILERIDIPRNQVFVEVIIGEISLDKGTQLGLEFWINRYLNRTSFGTKGGLGVYKGTNEDGTPITTSGSGSNFYVNGVLPGTQFDVLINALVENSKINIISTPKITVLENEEAEISIGSDVPVIASESALPTGAGGIYPVQSVQYISTGIILKVNAAILSGNKIALNIEQEISEALENKKSEISSPEILKRTIKTTMLVQEGQIAFIGGLFQNKITTTGSGIPVLSKIPLLGKLFKSSKKQLKKTELVVFINSRTLRKRNDMQDIVDGVKKMFSETLYIENGINKDINKNIDKNKEDAPRSAPPTGTGTSTEKEQ